MNNFVDQVSVMMPNYCLTYADVLKYEQRKKQKTVFKFGHFRVYGNKLIPQPYCSMPEAKFKTYFTVEAHDIVHVVEFSPFDWCSQLMAVATATRISIASCRFQVNRICVTWGNRGVGIGYEYNQILLTFCMDLLKILKTRKVLKKITVSAPDVAWKRSLSQYR